LKQSLRNAGVPEESLNTTVSSLSSSTIKQYSTHVKSWWLFCQRNSLDVYCSTPGNVIRFLNELFSNGSNYGSLNSARSALSLILPRINGIPVGESPTVKRFLKGTFRLRPTTPKYKFIWDPAPVLGFLTKLYPLEDLSLKSLTLKLVGLLSLATAQRLQTLAAISIANIDVQSDGINIIITEMLKTTKPGNPNPTIYLPFLTENPALCVASVINYRDRTANLRNNCQNLQITFAKPHTKASTQTIARWVKLVLTEAGIDCNSFSAHSTRHAATSAASRNGVSIESIRASAGWTPASSVFQKHYQRPILEKNRFVQGVLLH